MNVVRHGESDIIGICTSDTKQYDRRTLKKSELALYRIDHKKLATKIAETIGFTEKHEKITDHTAFWKFGVLNPQAEYSFPVYCFLGQASSQLDKIVNQLCMMPGSEYQLPIPVGATWEQFCIEFTATEMLLVSCSETQERLEPEHLKMKNQNSGKSTLQWTLLRSLATTGGSISWQNQDVTDRVKKQKQKLANKLKQLSVFQKTRFLGMKARKHTKQASL